MNFLNIEKNKIFRILFFSMFHVFFTFYALSNIIFSSAVPPGSGAFQMPTCPASSASSSAKNLRGGGGGEGPISETPQ